MRKLMIITWLFLSTTPVLANDWTPVLGNLLTKNSQKNFLKNKKPIPNFLDTLFEATITNSENPTLTINAKKGIYPSIPRTYQPDIEVATLRKLSKCTTMVTIPLKNATLFGQPIQHIRYTLNSPHCDMDARSDSVLFAPMHEPTYQRLKQQLKFVPLYSPQDAQCVGDTNYPIAIFNKKANEVVLDIEHINEDC